MVDHYFTYGRRLFYYVPYLEMLSSPTVCVVLVLTFGTIALESKAQEPYISTRLPNLLYTTEQCI